MVTSDHTTVYVVDDDEGVRDSLFWLLSSTRVHVECYGSAADFLGHFDPERTACMVLDVRLQNTNGLDLLDQLRQNGHRLPVVVVTGYGDVAGAVRAFQADAVDFIEKPYSDVVLLERVHAALDRYATERRELIAHDSIRRRMGRLSAREREVLAGIVLGGSTRKIAESFERSARTVEAHRARIMRKMEAHSLADLVRMVVSICPHPTPEGIEEACAAHEDPGGQPESR